MVPFFFSCAKTVEIRRECAFTFLYTDFTMKVYNFIVECSFDCRNVRIHGGEA